MAWTCTMKVVTANSTSCIIYQCWDWLGNVEVVSVWNGVIVWKKAVQDWDLLDPHNLVGSLDIVQYSGLGRNDHAWFKREVRGDPSATFFIKARVISITERIPSDCISLTKLLPPLSLLFHCHTNFCSLILCGPYAFSPRCTHVCVQINR